MRPSWAAGLCAVLAASAAHAQGELDFSKMDVTPRKIAENFYVIDETPAHGGSITILTGPEGVLLVDTGVGGLAAKVDAEIKKLSSKSVRYVINTHAHVDEIGGNEFFAKAGAIFIGRDLTREAMVNPKPVSAAPGDGRAARQGRMPPAEAAPTITFVSEMGLHINHQDLKLMAIPRAHTDNDAVIVFTGLDIIAVGDVLRAGEYPSINRPSGGSLSGMLTGLDKMLALAGPNTRFVTSHGQVVGREAVTAQRTLLVTTRDRVAGMIKQGKTAEEVVAADVTKGLGAHAEPGHVSADAFVRDVYAELNSAKP